MGFLFYVFLFFVFKTPLNNFLFLSPILLTLWFRYLQTRIKESCMYLSSQFFSKTPHKTLKFQEKSKKNAFSNCLSVYLNFKNVLFGVHHGATPRSHWTKQTVKKFNLWGKTAVKKSVWIKAWKKEMLQAFTCNFITSYVFMWKAFVFLALFYWYSCM